MNGAIKAIDVDIRRFSGIDVRKSFS